MLTASSHHDRTGNGSPVTRAPAASGLRRRLVIAALALGSFAPARTHATVIQPMDLADLATASRLIVHGHVIEVAPHWVRGGRQIDSLVTVNVEAYIKGALGRRLSFLNPGGQIGVYRTIVPGAPVFSVGDEVVLFLDSVGTPGNLFVLGLSQGALRVFTDDSGEKRVLAPVILRTPSTSQHPVIPERLSMTLIDLARQIAKVLAQHQSSIRVR